MEFIALVNLTKDGKSIPKGSKFSHDDPDFWLSEGLICKASEYVNPDLRNAESDLADLKASGADKDSITRAVKRVDRAKKRAK